MEKLEKLKCPLCSSEICRFEEDYLKYKIYTCNVCELTFSFPMESTFDYSNEKTHNRKEIEKVEEIINYILCMKDKVYILEIGAGDLRHLISIRKKFQHDNIELHAFDLSYTEESKKKAFEYKIKLLNDLNSNYKYDIIFLFHVLEHVPDLKDFLHLLKSKLNLPGFLIFSVPNPYRITKKIFKEDWDNPPYHLSRFSERTLVKISEIMDLHLVDILRYRLTIFDFYLFYVNSMSLVSKFISKFRIGSKKSMVSENNVYKSYSSHNKIIKYLAKSIISTIIFLVSVFLFVILKIAHFLTFRVEGLSMVGVYCKKLSETECIVFDFDGTIVKLDTFITITKLLANRSKLKKIFLKVILFIYRKGLITNTHLKNLIIKCIWRNIKTSDLQLIAKSLLSNTTVFNSNIVSLLKDKIQSNKNVYIISASPRHILECFLELVGINSGCFVMGSSLNIGNNNCIKGLKLNLHSYEKLNILKLLGIYKISEFYTDSYEDSPLMKNSEMVFLVRNNEIVELSK